MSAVGSQPLTLAIVSFRVAVEGLDAHDDVCALMTAIDKAIAAEKPRVALNRRFAKLNQARPGIFRRLSLWLKIREVKAQVGHHGAHWAWMIWRRAAIAMQKGAKPHAAFGMNQGGRPTTGFSRAADAAIYAVHATSNMAGLGLEQAIQDAAEIYMARKDEIYKALPLAFALCADDLAAAVKHSADKRR